ncbi:MAG TPA: hypothetical protein VFR80_15365 [Pyrinomonadaceae bacterium]|nr:hypothetical protein [Pyrinomonadaceae bacterium]
MNRPLGASVLLPLEPREEKKSHDSPHGPYATVLYMSKADPELYLVSWVDYDPKFNFDPVKELEANRVNLVKTVNGKLLTSKKNCAERLSGVLSTGESTRIAFKSQVFIVGKRPYLLCYAFPPGKESLLNSAGFFIFSPRAESLS